MRILGLIQINRGGGASSPFFALKKIEEFFYRLHFLYVRTNQKVNNLPIVYKK